jgi:hypothetical protein
MNKFQAEFLKKLETHILYSTTFFFENRVVYETKWKTIAREVQTTGDNMAHSHWMLDT